MTTSNTPQSSCIDPATINQALNVRLDRAQEFVDQGRVHPVANMPDHYVVEGENSWFVANGECCCEDYMYRQPLHQGWCKHRLAVALYKKNVLAEITPMTEAERARKLNDLYQ
jgi:hypothetical protein